MKINYWSPLIYDRQKGRSLIGWIVLTPFMLFGLAIALIIIGILLCETNKTYWDYQVKKMCKEDDGVEIFEHIKVTAKEFEKMSKGNFKSKKYSHPSEILYIQRKQTTQQYNLLRIKRTKVLFLRISDNKPIARYFHNSRIGGDFPSPSHGSSYSCPPPNTVSVGWKNIFILKEK